MFYCTTYNILYFLTIYRIDNINIIDTLQALIGELLLRVLLTMNITSYKLLLVN